MIDVCRCFWGCRESSTQEFMSLCHESLLLKEGMADSGLFGQLPLGMEWLSGSLPGPVPARWQHVCLLSPLDLRSLLPPWGPGGVAIVVITFRGDVGREGEGPQKPPPCCVCGGIVSTHSPECRLCVSQLWWCRLCTLSDTGRILVLGVTRGCAKGGLRGSGGIASHTQRFQTLLGLKGR